MQETNYLGAGLLIFVRALQFCDEVLLILHIFLLYTGQIIISPAS